MRISTLATRNSEGGRPHSPLELDRCPGTPPQDFTLSRIQPPDISSLSTPTAGPKRCGEGLPDSTTVADSKPWGRGRELLLIPTIKGVTQLERLPALKCSWA